MDDGWIEWGKSGECPIDPNAMIEIKAVMPGEIEPRVLFKRSAWASMWDNPDVIAYRIV